MYYYSIDTPDTMFDFVWMKPSFAVSFSTERGHLTGILVYWKFKYVFGNVRLYKRGE